MKSYKTMKRKCNLALAKKNDIVSGKKKKRKKKAKQFITKTRFRKAMRNSFGIKTEIARRLGCTYDAIHRRLKREDWADIRFEMQQESERMACEAEEAIVVAMKQRINLKVMADAAKWVLEKLRPEKYRKDPDVNVTVASQTVVPVAHLGLSLEQKKALLSATEDMDADFVEIE